MRLLGFDIGGTKCAVVLGETGEQPQILDRLAFSTNEESGWQGVVERLLDNARQLLAKHPSQAPAAAGISCGGPLSSREGLVLSPPNLPGWDRVPIVQIVRERLGIPCALQNDANACALAEWQFGAGQNCENMIFLTFGTGMGAGLIINGRLYSGTNDMAGEVGHIRLCADGPLGYGKNGSFEGFCSGGGIADLARGMAKEQIAAGNPPAFCKTVQELPAISAKSVALAAQAGDALALEVYRVSGTYLGRGLSILLDLLNPQRIVIGSIFARSSQLLCDAMQAEIEREALPHTRACCEIVPAQLGDAIGDWAALGVAMQALPQK